MDALEQLVITDVKEPLQVYFERGRRSQMRQRATYGLSLCLDGQITYMLNGRSVTSTKGTAVLLPKGGTYALKGERDGLFWVFNFLCEGFACEEILSFTLANPAVCQAIASNIRHLYGHDGSRLEILGEFYKLLDRVTRQPTASHLAPIVGYIEQNLSDATLTNTKIAQRATISEVYLRKLFLQQYHVTPKQFILNRRLQKAKQLLTDTERTVTQVSMECGFSGLYHFCRIFKEKTGMTPSEYAKQFRTFEI